MASVASLNAEACSTLAPRFGDLYERLGAQSSLSTTAQSYFRDVLAARHGEPGRAYHTLRHLAEMLALLDTALLEGAVQEGPEADLIELSVFFHDLVYDPKAR